MAVRWRLPRVIPIWLVVGGLVLGGWVLANVAVHTYAAYLHEIVMRMPDPDPSDPIVRRWQSDGARNLFAFFFGWTYGPVLWVLWSPVFATVWVVRKIRSRVRAASVAE